MSGPPPPIRNKALEAKKVSKSLRHRLKQDEDKKRATFPAVTSALALLNEEPDMRVGEHVKLNGNLTFESLLRIDGTVEGELIAPPDAGLIIGVNGTVIGNISNISTILIEGKVIGNIYNVESISIQDTGSVHGNLNVNPFLGDDDEEASGNDNQDNTKNINPDDGNDHDGNSKATKSVVFIIDPQLDFFTGGSAAVPGSTEDSEKISELIKDNIHNIDEIFVSLDSHHRMHIAHGIFWCNADGQNPAPSTVISLADLEKKVWFPRDELLYDHCHFYLQSLQKVGLEYRKELIIKPEHCLIGTVGHSIIPMINDSLLDWVEVRMRKVGYVMKGTSCLTDMQSAIIADVQLENDPSCSLDEHLLGRLQACDRLIVCGHMHSKTFNLTCRDLIKHWKKDKSCIRIVKNESPVHASDDVNDRVLYDDFKEYLKRSNIPVVRSEEAFI